VVDKYASYNFIQTSARCLVLTLACTVTRAEVIPDGSLGPADALQGPDYAINQNLGHTAGNNLFHSFEAFNINNGERATFYSAPSIENIISRVTGDQASWIDGPLRGRLSGTDTLSSANLYFLNPNGIIFGPNASLDIGGSFHASTAEELEFYDSEVFSAKAAAGKPILSAAKPETFGFLGEATIELRGTRLRSGHDITLSGGRIELREGARINTSAKSETINTIGGNAHLASSSGNITLIATETITFSGINKDLLGSGLQIGFFSEKTYTSGIPNDFVPNNPPQEENGSNRKPTRLHVDASTIELQDGAFMSITGAGSDSTLSVVASNRLKLSGTNNKGWGSTLHAGTLTKGGNAVRLSVESPIIELQDGALITTATIGALTGGELYVMANERLILSGSNKHGYGSRLSSSTFAEGDGGRIHIQAPVISLTNSASIHSSSEVTGNAGSITVIANDSLHLTGNSSISTAAQASSGGNINIQAGRRVHLQDSHITASVVNGQGSGGNITIGTTVIPDQGVSTPERVVFTPEQVVLTPELVMLNNSRITAKADAGQGGTIHIVANLVVTSADSVIDTSAGPAGINGNIQIEALHTDVSGSLATLPTAFIDVTKFLNNSCAKHIHGTASSFVVNGTSGTTSDPDHFLSAYALNAPPQLQRVADYNDKHQTLVNNTTPPDLLLVAMNTDNFQQNQLDWSCN